MATQNDETEPAAAALVREALDETRELVRLEVAMAREEVKAELKRAKVAGVSLGASAVLALVSATMFFFAIAAVFTRIWLAALILGGILLVVATVVGFVGYKALPRKPLGQTRERLETDVKQLRERVA